GLKKGDRVALMMPNCPQFVISYFGALRAGAIVTATSSMYTAREVTHQWNDAGAKFAIVDRRLFPVVKSAMPELSSVEQMVLTGMRQYYPQHFTKLRASLDGVPKMAKASGSSGALRTMRPTMGPSVYAWDDLLSIARTPGP